MMFRVICLGLAFVCTPSVSLCKLTSFISQDVQKITATTTSSRSTLHNINPRVYQMAMKAYQRATRMGVAKKPVMTIIDYSLPSTQPRMWVIDTARNKVMFHTHVAHGSGSGGNKAERFSDVPGSYQTSLGVFVTGSTYQGKHGTSLELHGLEKGINGNALRRRIVIHGAHYVSDHIIQSKGRLGRSWGCPALNTKVAQPIIQTIKGGSLIFAYYPDEKWMKRSTFLS
jgi:hypothetical protein